MNPGPDSADEWFARTLDAEQFDGGQTLRPIDHPAATVPPPVSPTVRADATQRDLPLLTWTDAADGTTANDAAPVGHSDFVRLALLGEGGMGRVHLARQRSLGREVALKTVKAEADRPAVRAGLWREALVMGRLDHPNVVPVHVLGTDREGRPALVMKRIEGSSWQDLLNDPVHPVYARLGGRDRLETHLEILCSVAVALEFAHSRGVLHRDVKPDNVMVGAFGEVYLGDWGVALELGTPDSDAPEPIVGTPAFLAPELLSHRRADQGPHTDVFLLGATLHAVLTGQPRHAGKTLRQVLDAVGNVRPIAYGAGVPAGLAAIANRATAARPADRFASAAEFRVAVRWWLQRRGLDDVVHAAQKRLAELDAVVAAGPGAARTDAERNAYIRTVHQFATEARFGFLEVKKADPGHADAVRGLDACLERMIAFAIDQGHLAEARALYQELGRPVDRFDAGLRGLQAAEEATVADRAAFERLKLDHDPTVGIGTRLALVVPLFVFSLGITVWMHLVAVPQRVDQSVRMAWIFTAGVCIVSALVWKRATTAVSRQVLVTGVATTLLMLLHRHLVQWQQGPEAPVSLVLRDDALLLALAAFLMFRQSAWAVAAGVVGVAMSVATVWMPERAAMVFSVGTILYMGAIVGPMALAGRRGAGKD